MAFVATASTQEPRSFSIGPLKVQLMSYSVEDGDTSGTITADRLNSVLHVFADGAIQLTSAPSISGNVVTLAFADPANTRVGTIILLGR